MRWLSRLRRRARLVVDRTGVEREMDAEMRFHLEMEAEELARFGANTEEARRAARRRFGGVARYQDDARDARGGRIAPKLEWSVEALRSVPGVERIVIALPPGQLDAAPEGYAAFDSGVANKFVIDPHGSVAW